MYVYNYITGFYVMKYKDILLAGNLTKASCMRFSDHPGVCEKW